MKFQFPLAVGLVALYCALFAGCGKDEGQNVTGAAVENSQQCISTSCHGGTTAQSVSPVTGACIVDEWQQSTHYSGNAAGCVDCHGLPHHTPGTCGVCHGTSIPTASQVGNPDAAGKCLTCHGTAKLGTPHFGNFTGISHPAQYVDLQNIGRCRNCHNPHNNTVLQEAKQWANSAHGDVTGVAWSTEDFKNSAGCIRCHTATGYVGYVTSSPAFTVPTTPLAASNSYGVLGCNACHASYAFKASIRNVPPYTAPYNGGKSPKAFPDVGYSNLCIPCHAGRESGDTVLAVTNFTNASFKNPHYFAAAGLMYMSTGFVNFTTCSGTLTTSNGNVANYAKTLLPDNVSTPGGVAGGVTSTHRKLGTTAINGDSHNTAFFLPGNLDTNGPCVTCHMNGFTNAGTSRPTSHSLAISADAFNQVCKNCHTSEGGVALTGANFRSVFLEPQSEVFENALSLAITLLQTKYKIMYNQEQYPYFYDLAADPTGKTAVTDWTRGTGNQTVGLRIMGSCFNINLLKRDPAAFAHGRTFARRLLYDTIDYLDDGKINLSASVTAIATNPALYGKGARAYTDGTLTTLSPGTTESMLYLIGWSRTTGAWNTPERP